MALTGNEEVREVLNRVSKWPVQQRLDLTQGILKSLEERDDEAAKATGPRDPRRLIGLLKTDHPPPTDYECESILGMN